MEARDVISLVSVPVVGSSALGEEPPATASAPAPTSQQATSPTSPPTNITSSNAKSKATPQPKAKPVIRLAPLYPRNHWFRLAVPALLIVLSMICWKFLHRSIRHIEGILVMFLIATVLSGLSLVLGLAACSINAPKSSDLESGRSVDPASKDIGLATSMRLRIRRLCRASNLVTLGMGAFVFISAGDAVLFQTQVAAAIVITLFSGLAAFIMLLALPGVLLPVFRNWMVQKRGEAQSV